MGSSGHSKPCSAPALRLLAVDQPGPQQTLKMRHPEGEPAGSAEMQITARPRQPWPSEGDRTQCQRGHADNAITKCHLESEN